ncbi:MAG: drug/metabolite transporter (DMT)-like permease [Gammaproteobacteria bacterium]|jgi:drug/metabolite transporter (DMT)-like permease
MNHNQLVGRAIALSAAIFYGFNTTLSRLAYDTGTTPASLTFYRFLMSTVAMVIIVLILRKGWRLKVRPLVFFCCVFGMVATSLGHLGAVNYIPVSLSAIIFYTFPLQVVLYKRLINRELVNRFELGSFILAFIGIGIALGPEFQGIHPIGLFLACFGSFGATLFILSYERFPDDADSYVATLWIMIASLIVASMMLASGMELVPPREYIGWRYLTLITIFSVAAFILSLQAINLVGGGVFAMFLNMEPAVILILAWLVIGEELTIARIVGIALVVLALFLSHWKPKQTTAPVE